MIERITPNSNSLQIDSPFHLEAEGRYIPLSFADTDGDDPRQVDTLPTSQVTDLKYHAVYNPGLMSLFTEAEYTIRRLL